MVMRPVSPRNRECPQSTLPTRRGGNTQEHPRLQMVGGTRWEVKGEPRVSCLNPGKPSRDLLQHVSRPDSPTMAREQ